MLRELMPDRTYNFNDPLRTAHVMTYELGDLVKGLVYSLYSKGHAEEARIALADLVTMSRLLAEQKDWDWEELLADGEERFQYRMKEIAEGVL